MYVLQTGRANRFSWLNEYKVEQKEESRMTLMTNDWMGEAAVNWDSDDWHEISQAWGQDEESSLGCAEYKGLKMFSNYTAESQNF